MTRSTRNASKKQAEKQKQKSLSKKDQRQKQPSKPKRNRQVKKSVSPPPQKKAEPKGKKGGKKQSKSPQKSVSPQPAKGKKVTRKGKNKKDKSPSPSSSSSSDQPVKKLPRKGRKPKSKAAQSSSSSSPSQNKKPAKKVKKSKSKDSKKPQSEKKSPVKKTQSKDMKKIVMKGSAPVDPHFNAITNCKVLVHNNIVYATTLNQSNIANNNNKFYICQVLQSETNPPNYYFFTRWGRVGVVGQMAPIGPIPRDFAISQYNQKIREKTKSGDYRVVQMNYDAEQQPKQDQPDKQKKAKQMTPEIKSDLNPKVQDLIRTIFDMKMMNNQMKEIGYDAKKMPLGKLAKSSIMKGYNALKGLMDQVKGKRRKQVLDRLSSDFYSQIPHDFGFMRMQNFVLDTEKKVKAKLEMLQSLQDIQIFTKILDQGKINSDMNQLDSNYLKLNTEIEPLSKDSQRYKMLVEYVKNTHATTHTSYHLQVEQIFVLNKETENARYTKHINNKQLLWHGSRLTNFVGIISQGLRIAPPQAPVTGYMFGKGVYFADMVSKSANYCFTNKINNTGLMLLCEVALGEINQKKYADYYANLLPAGKSSTKGLGKTAPLTGKDIQDDVFVPMGIAQPTGIADTSLLYNQFIVYDVAQIKCRYLFKMKFNYH